MELEKKYEEIKVPEQKPVNNQSDFQKLLELKKLKDKDIILAEEFEEKKDKVSFKILTLAKGNISIKETHQRV